MLSKKFLFLYLKVPIRFYNLLQSFSTQGKLCPFERLLQVDDWHVLHQRYKDFVV